MTLLSIAQGLSLPSVRSAGEVTLTPPTVAPVLTVAVTDVITDPHTANLTWTASNKTSSAGFGYRIYRAAVSLPDPEDFAELTTTTGTGYDDYVGTATNELYTYYIEPYNDAGPATGGGLSNQAGVMLPGELEAPILSGPSPVFASPFLLSWTLVPGATTYDLERSTDNITFVLLVNTALCEYETDEASQASYYFRVMPLAGAVEGPVSNTVTIEYYVPLPWILADGTWDDGGEWRDASIWND